MKKVKLILFHWLLVVIQGSSHVVYVHIYIFLRISVFEAPVCSALGYTLQSL